METYTDGPREGRDGVLCHWAGTSSRTQKMGKFRVELPSFEDRDPRQELRPGTGAQDKVL